MEETWRAQGRRIGWESAGEIYLDLSASVAAAHEVARGSAPIAVGEDTLRKRLHERGHLASTELETRDTYAVRRRLEGKRRIVLHVRSDFLEADRSGDAPGTGGAGGDTHPTTDSTSPEPLFGLPEAPDGQVGQVPAEGNSNAVGALTGRADLEPGRDAANQGTCRPEPDHPDHPDRLDEADAEAERARLVEKFPDLSEERP